MKQTTFIFSFVAICAILIINPLKVFSQKNDRPNVLWLTSEDNTADWLGCYGNSYSETPNLDKLAKEGFQYMNAFANAPACSPSRSTLITGVMAVSMGTHPQRCRYKIPHDKIKYYPDFLRTIGYYTGNDKKTDYNIGGRKDNECWNNVGATKWDEIQKKQPFFQVINFGESHESKIYSDLTNVNKNRHDAKKTKLRTYHPDLPIMRNTYAHYYDAINNLDTAIGKALQKLEELGLAENTIVIYNSDHGGTMPRSKRFLFRNSLNCPLIIRIPERYKHLWPAEKTGSKIDRLVSFVDMPKTWLNILGSKTPDYMQGTVFLGKEKQPEEAYHFSFRGRMEDRFDNARAISDKKYLYIRNYMPYVPWMQHYYHIWREDAAVAWEKEVVAGRANKVQSRLFKPKQTEELYDMQKDPDCTENLVNKPELSQIVTKMKQALREKQIKIYDAGLLPELDMVRLSKTKGTTIYEMARNTAFYNVKTLLDAADLALEENPKNLSKLHQMLDSKDIGQRYWGIVGCFLLKDKKAGFKVLKDESHEIRAMGAWLLIETGETKKGYECMSNLLNEKSYASIKVLNIIDWMGEKGKKLMPAVKNLNTEKMYPKQISFVKDHLIKRHGN